MDLTTTIENKRSLQPYAEKVRQELRVLMTKQQYSYDDLVFALEQQGICYSSSNLRNKVSHGALPASLYIAILDILATPK